MQLNKNSVLKFWAKTSPSPDKSNAFHPLICHLIDVAVVAKKIWAEVLPKAAKKRIAEQFAETEITDEILEKIGRSVAFIAGLHDLGKCSPPFQLRGHCEKGKGRHTEKLLELYQETEFWKDSVPPAKDAPHGYVTTIELPEILQDYGFNPKISEQISIFIGGHHGIFPNSDWRKKGKKAIEANLGNEHWEKARRELTDILAKLLNIQSLKQSEEIKLNNGTIMILAGLISVADWIGSDTEFFKCEISDFKSDFDLNLSDYSKCKKSSPESLKTARLA